MRIDALKIDRSFVDPIGTESPLLHVTGRIIQIGIDLRLIVIAEGIEREEQAAYLKERGVTLAQGWHYSQPVPASEFIAFWAERQKRHGSGSPTWEGRGKSGGVHSPVRSWGGYERP